MSIKSIAKQMNTTDTRISRLLKMHGVEIKTKSDMHSGYYTIENDKINSLIKKYSDAKTPIALLLKEYNISRFYFDKIIKDFAIKRNSRSEGMHSLWALGIKKPSNRNKGGTKDIHNALFNRWRTNAKVRSYPFNISIEYLQCLLEQQKHECALTGIKLLCPKNYAERKEMTSSPYLISLDRINSDIGYVDGNVQFVCVWANIAKGKYSNDMFKDIIKKLRNV